MTHNINMYSAYALDVCLCEQRLYSLSFFLWLLSDLQGQLQSKAYIFGCYNADLLIHLLKLISYCMFFFPALSLLQIAFSQHSNFMDLVQFFVTFFRWAALLFPSVNTLTPYHRCVSVKMAAVAFDVCVMQCEPQRWITKATLLCLRTSHYYEEALQLIGL